MPPTDRLSKLRLSAERDRAIANSRYFESPGLSPVVSASPDPLSLNPATQTSVIPTPIAPVSTNPDVAALTKQVNALQQQLALLQRKPNAMQSMSRMGSVSSMTPDQKRAATGNRLGIIGIPTMQGGPSPIGRGSVSTRAGRDALAARGRNQHIGR